MQSSLTQESWDQQVIDLGGSMLQSWVWGEFQQALGYRIFRLSTDSFISLVVELPLPLKKNYLYAPKGPLGEVPAALEEIKTLAEDDHSLVFIRIEPYVKQTLPVAVKEIQPNQIWLLNLEKTEQELLIGMKPKTRYNINLAQRKGVTIREGGQADLLSFWQLLLATASRNRFKLHPQNYYLRMWESLSPKYLKLLLAEYQGQLLAGSLLSWFGDTVSYLHGGSAGLMKEAQAPYLLHWESMRLAKNLGYKFYDFGGVSTDPKHPWAGISRFKKGFGGFEVNFPGAYDLVFSPIWYNVYKQVRIARRLLRHKKNYE